MLSKISNDIECYERERQDTVGASKEYVAWLGVRSLLPKKVTFKVRPKGVACVQMMRKDGVQTAPT